jgi:manganese efflux pump family protein
MIGMIMLLGLALALDSFAVSASIGAAGLTRSRYLGLPIAFGICDGLASLLGALIQPGPNFSATGWLGWIGPLSVATYALYVLVLTRLTLFRGSQPGNRWMVFGLPLCLSLDNLLTGGRLTALGMPVPITAVLLGFCSGLCSLAGLQLGCWGLARWPYQARRVAIFGLLVLALVITVIQD